MSRFSVTLLCIQLPPALNMTSEVINVIFDCGVVMAFCARIFLEEINSGNYLKRFRKGKAFSLPYKTYLFYLNTHISLKISVLSIKSMLFPVLKRVAKGLLLLGSNIGLTGIEGCIIGLRIKAGCGMKSFSRDTDTRVFTVGMLDVLNLMAGKRITKIIWWPKKTPFNDHSDGHLYDRNYNLRPYLRPPPGTTL